MKFLVNPRAARPRRRTARPSKKQLAARKKFAAMARRQGKRVKAKVRKRTLMINSKRATTMARRRKRRNPTRATASRRRMRRNPSGKYIRSVKRRGKKVTRTAWKRSGFKRNPVARRGRRRSLRRNPGFVAGLMRGVKDAVAVTAGKVGYNLLSRQVADKIPLPIPGLAGTAVKGLLVAGLGAFAVSKVLRGDAGRFVIAGMYAGLIEGLVRGANIPVVSGALGEYDVATNTIDAMGSYPTLASYQTMGAYPNQDEMVESQGAYGM